MVGKPLTALTRRRAATYGIALGLWIGGIEHAVSLLRVIHARGDIGFDAHAYWVASRGSGSYEKQPGQRDAFNYAPPVADLLSAFAWLSWPAFWLGWTIMTTCVFWWLLRPLGRLWGPPAFLYLCFQEVVLGNIFAFMAAALVVALARPSAKKVAFVAAALVLTKVTPGLALGWFVFRRDWRCASAAAAAPLAVVALGVAVDPGPWKSWFHYLLASGDGGASWLLARLLLAAVVVFAAARGERSWLVPVAVLLSLPWIGGLSVLALLAAVPRLLAARKVEIEASGSPPTARDLARPAGDVGAR